MEKLSKPLCLLTLALACLPAPARFTRLKVTEGKVRFRRLNDGVEVTVRTGEYASAGSLSGGVSSG